MMKKLFFSLALIAASAMSAFAQGDPMAPLPNDPAYRTGVLDNGLTYYIRHNEKPAQRADFYFVANVGAIEESPAQDGLAHFYEHMALNGSKNLPGKTMLDYFQSIGVEFGRNINASTGVEQTIYQITDCPTIREGIIDTAILTLHDYCYFTTNDFEEIEKERGVIVEEWRTRRTASWRIHEQTLPYLYKDSKYATCTLIGDVNNIKTFDPQCLVDFYKTWYHPELQALVIVGDVDVDAIEAKLKERFQDIPKSEVPVQHLMPVIPDNEEPIVGIITDPETNITSISALFKTPAVPYEVRSTFAGYIDGLVKGMICNIINERLNDISVQPDAPFIGASVSMGRFVRTSDAISCNLNCNEGKGVEAFAAVMSEMEKAKRYGFTDDEVERIKTNYLRSFERAKDAADTRTNGQLVNAPINSFLKGSSYLAPDFAYDLVQQIMGMVSVEALNQSVAQLFDFSRNAVVIYTAKEKEGLTHPTEAELASVIESLPALEIAAPEASAANEALISQELKGCKVKKEKAGAFGFTEWKLKNGITVAFRQTDLKKDQVLFSMSNRGGKSLVADADMKYVDDNFVSLYFGNSGVSNFPETKLSKMLAGKSVGIGPSLGGTTHGYSGSCSTKDFETLLQLAYLYSEEPRYVEDEYASSLAQIKAVIPNVISTPGYVFSKHIQEKLYTNPERNQAISPEMVESFDYNEMVRVLKSVFSQNGGAVVTIIGDIDAETVKPLVQKYLGSIKTSKKTPKIQNTNNFFVQGKYDEPIKTAMTTPKSTVLFCLNAPCEFNLKNMLLASVTDYILDLIYVETIREEEGGTYGVSTQTAFSYVDTKPTISTTIQFDTNVEKVDVLSDLALKGYYDFAEQGPTEDQLSKAKENLLKNIPESRISNGYWTNCWNTLRYYGFDRDAEFEATVNSITAEDVQNFVKNIAESGNFFKSVLSPEE